DVEEVEGRLSDFDQADMAVLLDADISVLAHGVSFFELAQAKPARSAQAKPAGDDAAQHFGGAALDRQLGRGLDGEVELLFQRLAVGSGFLDKGGEIAHTV